MEHEEKAVAAILAEYSQLRDTDTVRALRPSALSKSQKQGALELLTLIKKERCKKKEEGRSFVANGTTGKYIGDISNRC